MAYIEPVWEGVSPIRSSSRVTLAYAVDPYGEYAIESLSKGLAYIGVSEEGKPEQKCRLNLKMIDEMITTLEYIRTIYPEGRE